MPGNSSFGSSPDTSLCASSAEFSGSCGGGLSVRDICLVSLFAALTAVGGWFLIPLPFSPVPVSLQTFFVYVSGLFLGSRQGGLSMGVYLLLGCAGIPVFAGFTSGPGILLGPTGGYLAGFVVSGFVIGFIRERFGRGSGKCLVFADIAACLAGAGVIYLLGCLYLSYLTGMSLSGAALVGALPFIPGDAVKIAAAVLVVRQLRRVIRGV